MGSSANVWILGGYQSDFARNLTREGLDFADLTAEVVENTLTAAKVDASAIEVVHVANAFGEMFARQGHLGAMPASVNDGLWDTPRPATKPRARPEASRPWPLSPICGPAHTHCAGRRRRTGEDRAR